MTDWWMDYKDMKEQAMVNPDYAFDIQVEQDETFYEHWTQMPAYQEYDPDAEFTQEELDRMDEEGDAYSDYAMDAEDNGEEVMTFAEWRMWLREVHDGNTD